MYIITRCDTLSSFCLLQVVSANQIVGQGGTVDPVKVLTVVMEKSALLNYKKIFSTLNGILCLDHV